VADTLRKVEMGYHDPDLHKKAFENSYVTVFLFHDNHMIGFGRAISDFRKMKTGLALFTNAQKMLEKGFTE